MINLVQFFFFFNLSFGSGFPVVDTNQLVNELKDSAYLIDSVGELIEEVGIAAEEAQQLAHLQAHLNGLATDLRTLQSFSEDVSDLGQFQSMRGFILADRIRAFTRYLRKLKRVISTAMAIRARPQAMLVTLQLLEQERQRENEKLEAKLMAASEMEKINEVRNKVKHEIARKEQLNHEMNNIYNVSKSRTPLKVDFKKNKGKQGIL